MTGLEVTPGQNNFGAKVHGLDLSCPLPTQTIEEVRDLWLQYQLLYFEDQPLQHDQLARFTQYFGEHGDDPYVKAISADQPILEVRRSANEETAPFGSSWHSDWSFLVNPPSATILHAKTVPPHGGDTLYADGFRAYDTLDTGLAKNLEALTAIHSARRSYSHEAYHRGGGEKRSMTILPSDKAWETQLHPIIRTHPESGRKALWVNPVYTIGIENLPEKEAQPLLQRLFDHALSDAFIYQHSWRKNMLTMWDNRSVQHCAQGGYDGYERIMHRTTVAGDQPH